MTKNTNSKKQHPIYVIAGEDESLLNSSCEKLLETLLEPQQKDTALFRPDADNLAASTVLDELRTLPFLTKKRVVLIKNAGKFISKNRKWLEPYFDNPSDTGILIMSVSSWNKNTKLAKKLKKTGKLINASPPSTSQIPKRLMDYAKEAHGKKLNYNDARLLIDFLGDSLPQLYAEIDKLAIYANDKNNITAEDIKKLTGDNRLFNCFEVIDSCLRKNIPKAVRQLRKMFAEDKSAEYTAVGAFAYQFRKMFNAKVMLEKGTHPAQIAKQLRIWSNKKEAFFSLLRKLPLSQIAYFITRLAETDFQIKTGRTTPQTAVERLVLKLATK